MIKLVIGVTLGVVALALLVGSTSSSDESSAGVVGGSSAYSSAGDPYATERQVAQEGPPLAVETPNSVVADVLSMHTTPAPTVAVLKPITVVKPSDEVIKPPNDEVYDPLGLVKPDHPSGVVQEDACAYVTIIGSDGIRAIERKDPDACKAQMDRAAGFW